MVDNRFKSKSQKVEDQSSMSPEEIADMNLDNQNLKTIEELAYGMLDFFVWKQDSSLINEDEFNEIVQLAAIKHTGIYRLLLMNVIKDLGNDKFVKVYKLKGLGIVILNLALKSSLSDDDYSSFYTRDKKELNQSD